MYFPPYKGTSHQKPQYMKTVRRMLQWYNDLLCSTARDYTPLLYMDANSDLAPPASVTTDQSVVSRLRGTPNDGGRLIYEAMRATDISLINTFYDSGPTFTSKRGKSRIDFIGTASGNRRNVEKAFVMRDEAKQVRASPYIIDHYPLALKMYAPPPISRERHEVRWNSDALSTALHDPLSRQPFLVELQAAVEEHTEQLEMMTKDADPSRHNAAVFDIMRTVGVRHFGANETRRPPWYMEMRDERLELIRTRARHRAAVADAVQLETGPRGMAVLEARLRHITWRLRKFRDKCFQDHREDLVQKLHEQWQARHMHDVAVTARLLAGTRIGVRNRTYRCVSRVAAKAEWLPFLEQPGTEGGLAAVEVPVSKFIDYTQPTRTTTTWIGDARPTDCPIVLTGDHLAMGTHDFECTSRRLINAKRRKYAPPWSVPGELLLIVAKPQLILRNTKSSRAGVGAGSVNTGIAHPDEPYAPASGELTVAAIRSGLCTMDTGNFLETAAPWTARVDLSGYEAGANMLRDLCVHARAAGALPVQATTSMAACPPKRGKSGTGVNILRVIHCLCSWWSNNLRSVVMAQGKGGKIVRGAAYEAPYWAHGGIRCRRRETLMMVIRITM